jgi:hypothetical protein
VGNEANSLAWEAESVRFTAFPPPSVAFDIAPIWERLMGGPPQEIQERPQQGLRNEFGAFGEHYLFLTQQLGRFDIIFAMHPEKAATSADLVSIGPHEETTNKLSDVVRRWLKIAPPLGRLAYAPVLIYRAENQEAGYRTLQKLLPGLPIDPVNSRNLLWQINRPVRSKVLRELTINRLAKWSLFRKEMLQIIPERTGMIAGAGPVTFAVRLELDIYTEPFSPIPAESLERLYQEIAEHAQQLIAHGDVT